MTLENKLYRVVRGKDSLIELVLEEAGANVGSTEITRCDLVFKRTGVADITFTSADHASWFDLQDSEIVDGETIDTITINLSALPNPPAEGRYRVDVYLYDSDYTNGRYWGTIDVEVKDAPPAGS